MRNEKQKRGMKRRNPANERGPSDRNEEGEAGGARRNPSPPRTTVAELAVEAGLATAETGLTRHLVDVAVSFLQPLLDIRYDPKSGEPRVLTKDIQKAVDSLQHLRAAASCLLAPSAPSADWFGCPPMVARRNPSILQSTHIFDDDLGYEDDYLEDDNDE